MSEGEKKAMQVSNPNSQQFMMPGASTLTSGGIPLPVRANAA